MFRRNFEVFVEKQPKVRHMMNLADRLKSAHERYKTLKRQHDLGKRLRKDALWIAVERYVASLVRIHGFG